MATHYAGDEYGQTPESNFEGIPTNNYDPYGQQRSLTPPDDYGGDLTAGNTGATASMVLAIAAAILAWIGWLSLLGAVLSIIGIVLAVRARKSQPAAGSRAGSTAGLVMCVIALCLCLFGLIGCTALGITML